MSHPYRQGDVLPTVISGSLTLVKVSCLVVLGCGLLLVLLIGGGLVYNATRPYQLAERTEGPGGVFMRVTVPPGTGQAQMRDWTAPLERDHGTKGKMTIINFYYGRTGIENLVGQYSDGSFSPSRQDVPP
jgi:hypothetical protein